MAKKRAAKKTTAKKKKAVAKKSKAKVVEKAEMKKVEIRGIKQPGEAKPIYDVKIQTKKIGEAPKEYHFVLKGGEKLKSIKELASALEGMSEDVFRHHVTEVKNDFAKWVEDIFDEKKLAEEMRVVRSKMEAELKVLRHMIKKLGD